MRMGCMGGSCLVVSFIVSFVDKAYVKAYDKVFSTHSVW